MTLVLPKDAAEITPDWVTAALRAGGLGDVVVTGAQLTRLGQDQSFTGGALYRIALDYGTGEGPATLVVKLSPADPVQARQFFAANRREVAFYRRIAGQGGLPVPRCLYAVADPSHLGSAILLQDLGQGRSVPFVTGLAATDAVALVDALAQVHAHWWQHKDLNGDDGMTLADEFGLIDCWDRYPTRLRSLFGDVSLPPAFVDLVDHLVANRAHIFGDLNANGPVTLLHRDPQADNVIFDADGRAILFDWQMTGTGRGASDVAYALISSCTPDMRRVHERDLVARYCRALCQYGVTGYTPDQCWQDYLRGVAGKILMTIVATVLFDNASAHKIAWRRADLGRLLAFCADHAISPGTFA
jgi:aminoglycoside phosphotransferase (APT) family kinase protein